MSGTKLQRAEQLSKETGYLVLPVPKGYLISVGGTRLLHSMNDVRRAASILRHSRPELPNQRKK